MPPACASVIRQRIPNDLREGAHRKPHHAPYSLGPRMPHTPSRNLARWTVTGVKQSDVTELVDRAGMSSGLYGRKSVEDSSVWRRTMTADISPLSSLGSCSGCSVGVQPPAWSAARSVVQRTRDWVGKLRKRRGCDDGRDGDEVRTNCASVARC